MLLPLPRPPRSVDAVADHLRRSIVQGELAAGAHLPAERGLAAELGVSRLTLRAAVARLEAEGLVRARQGDGVKVLALGEHASPSVLAHMDLASRPDVVRSFLELRRAVAAEAVALACERATAAQVAGLERLAAAQAGETDEAAYVRRDVEFARAVLEAAGSFAALLVFNQLAPVYAANPALARALVADRERSLSGYAATVMLVRARDARRARELVRQALEQVDAAALRAMARQRRAAATPKRRRR